jgi:hypothetical protein
MSGSKLVGVRWAMGDREDMRLDAWHGIAAHRPQMPGCRRVFMVTNGPAKPKGLARARIGAIDTGAPQGSINPDNRRYLTAKVTHAGHKLDHLLLGEVESESAGCDEDPQRSTVSQRALA